MRKRRAAVLIILVFLVVVWSAFPIYWMINLSFMEERETISVPPHWLPSTFNFGNYASVFGLSQVSTLTSGQPEEIRKGLVNSLIIGLSASVIAVLISSLLAYVFSRFVFPQKGKFLLLLLLTRTLPPIAVVMPYYILFTSLQLVGTHLGLIITYMAILIPINVWFLIGIFASVPIELERAARVDGCGRLRTFYSVAMRIAAPGIVVTTLLSFSMCWNEFAFAQLLNAGSSAQTLQSSISGLFTHYVLYSLTGTALTLGIIPSVALTILLGRFMTQLKGLGSMTIREVA